MAQVAKAGEAASSEASKTVGELFTRLVGATVDEMGIDMRDRYRQRRMKKLVEKAARKAQMNTHDLIPSRVVAGAFEAIEWSDDEFLAEYLSGVLASSRTHEGQDDRGVTWIALLRSMSSTQIKIHFILYSAARRIILENDAGQYAWSQWTFFFPDEHMYGDLGEQFRDSPTEPGGVEIDPSGLYEALYGLVSADLIAELKHGNKEVFDSISWPGLDPHRRSFPDGGGFAYELTPRGIQLFLHAHGQGQHWVSALASPQVNLDGLHNELKLPPSTTGMRVSDLPAGPNQMRLL